MPTSPSPPLEEARTRPAPSPPPGSSPAPHRPWRADGALLGVALIWGVNIPAMKHVLGTLHPFMFNAWRLSLSTVVLGLLARREGAGHGATPWARVVSLAALGSVSYQLLFLLGMARTTAGNTALIIASVPVWTAVIAACAGTERLDRTAWSGLACVFLGTAAVTLEGGALDLSGQHLMGNLLVIAAAVCWATATVMSRSVVRQISPTRLAFLSTLISMPAHYLLAFALGGATFPKTATTGTWLWTAYSGLFSTGLAYVFWNYGVRSVGPSHTAVSNNLVPLIALVGSAWALREPITPAQIIGGAMILGGLVIMRRTR